MRFELDITLQRGAFTRHVRIDDDARVIAIEGASGCGKTSTLNAIAGLLRPASGRIAIDGQVLFDAACRIDLPAYRRRVGYVFQDLRLFPHLAVRGNLRYGLRAGVRTGGHEAPSARFGFDDVVGLLGIGSLLDRSTANLSGGETQRVAIGRALLSQPALLLLDEPLSSLDRARRDELLPWLRRVRDEVALPMVVVSHHDDGLRTLADAVHTLA